MNNDATLVYPGDYVRNNDITTNKHEFCNDDTGWQINAAEYEYNGSIVAHIDGMAPGDLLAAFAGDECRGIGEVLDNRAIFGHLTFALMTYTNETGSEELNFRYYDRSTDTIYDLSENIHFEPDAVIGGFDKPLELTIEEETGDSMLPATSLGRSFPNPFNPSGTIFYHLNETEQVNLSIYNIRGQKIKTLVNEHQPEGTHQIIWQGIDDSNRSVSSGVYFIKMRTEGYEGTSKIILLK